MSIRVELRKPIQPDGEYRTLASLAVDDDGSYELDDPSGVFPLDDHVLIERGPEDTRPGQRRLQFAEDPETWAHYLHRHLRTGYLVPVVTPDSRGN